MIEKIWNNVCGGRALRIAAGITIMALMIPASSEGAFPLNGNWEGITSQGEGVSFRVSNSKIDIFNITTRQPYLDDCYGVSITYYSYDIPVNINIFNFGKLWGNFTSPFTAEGTYYVPYDPHYINCYIGTIRWTARSKISEWSMVYPGSFWLENVAFANGLFMTIGNRGAIFISNDGVNWTQKQSRIDNDLSGITYGKGMYVVTAWDGTIYTSSNLEEWVEHIPVSDSEWLSNVVYGNGKFVAVGSTIKSSDDGIKWVDENAANYNFSGLIYANNTFWAVGDEVFASKDGDNWMEVINKANVPAHLSGIAYGNREFVITGKNGTILTSMDGIRWEQRNSGVSAWLDKISFENGSFVAVGEEGTIVISTDGFEWTAVNSGTWNNLNGVTYGRGMFVIVGDGVILTRSANLISSSLSGDLNNNGLPADAGDLVLMKRASIGEIQADSGYELNNNGQNADAGDLVLMKRASIGEIVLS